MARYFLVTCIVFTSIFHIISSSEVECGPNEVAKAAPNCNSDCCPSAKGQPSACPDPCASACECAFNHKRVRNGTCIPTRQCPPFPCGKNQVFNACPPICPQDICSQATPDGRCPLPGVIGIILECEPKCRCIEGYWKNEKKECVPYNQCPQFQTTCK